MWQRRTTASTAKRVWRGGYAEVLAGVRKTDGTAIAFKRVHAANTESLKRLAREVEIQEALADHPHVMPVLEVGDGGRWYVMPLAEGTLESLRSTLSDDEVLDAIDHAADGLQAAHALGHTHRDVTPRNILALRDNDARRFVLADFGLVQRPDTVSTSWHTGTGVVVGTAGFVAPELLRGRVARANEATDVYSVGQVIGWALTGNWPLAGERLEVPGRPRGVVAEANALDPDRRIQTVAVLRQRLADARRVLPMPTAQRAADLLAGNNPLVDQDDAEFAVVQMALDSPDDYDLWFDVLPKVSAETVGVLVSERPDDARSVAERFFDHLTARDGRWGDRSYDAFNRPLRFLQRIAAAAARERNWALLHDAAVCLFRSDAECVRYDQRRRTRDLVSQARGEAARVMADALRDVPEEIEWLTDEDWNFRAADSLVQSVLSRR